MKLAILSIAFANTATAFTPTVTTSSKFTLYSTEEAITEVEIDSEPITAPVVPAINGWSPDSYAPCFGLPGAVAPTGYFDPLGFAQKGISLGDIKRYRESEVMHGRVAMIATVGYLAGEATTGPFNIVGPANDQLQQMPAPAFALLTLMIGAAEIKRAQIGWVEPDFSNWNKTLWQLRESYYPGDVGFDPLGFKPSDSNAFANMQTKELQNGRLAMLGVAGMCSQELVNHRGIFETIEFYQKVYSGIDPYAACGDAIIC